LLKNIAKERIKEELVKAFSEGNPFALVGLLDEAEMLPILFPALALTKHVDQPIRYHPFDVYTHILLTLYHLQQINTNYLVRFSMLYHDV
jgi:tRNA nucleotidyltransferase/poly(A) polymerase